MPWASVSSYSEHDYWAFPPLQEQRASLQGVLGAKRGRFPNGYAKYPKTALLVPSLGSLYEWGFPEEGNYPWWRDLYRSSIELYIRLLERIIVAVTPVLHLELDSTFNPELVRLHPYADAYFHYREPCAWYVTRAEFVKGFYCSGDTKRADGEFRVVYEEKEREPPFCLAQLLILLAAMPDILTAPHRLYGPKMLCMSDRTVLADTPQRRWDWIPWNAFPALERSPNQETTTLRARRHAEVYPHRCLANSDWWRISET